MHPRVNDEAAGAEDLFAQVAKTGKKALLPPIVLGLCPFYTCPKDCHTYRCRIQDPHCTEPSPEKLFNMNWLLLITVGGIHKGFSPRHSQCWLGTWRALGCIFCPPWSVENMRPGKQPTIFSERTQCHQSCQKHHLSKHRPVRLLDWIRSLKVMTRVGLVKAQAHHLIPGEQSMNIFVPFLTHCKCIKIFTTDYHDLTLVGCCTCLCSHTACLKDISLP